MEVHSSDVLAARVQLEELRGQLQCTLDAELALRAALCCDADNGGALDDLGLLGEQFALDEQIASLEAFVASFEHEEAVQQAAELAAHEEAEAEASHQLAARLDAQMRWDAGACAHDAALARELAACDARTWNKSGDLIERPLDLSLRPAVPGAASCQVASSSWDVPDAVVDPMHPFARAF